MENAQREAQRLSQERGKFEAEASAALQDAREALARESEIQEQLQKADRVPCLFLPVSNVLFQCKTCCFHSCTWIGLYIVISQRACSGLLAQGCCLLHAVSLLGC